MRNFCAYMRSRSCLKRDLSRSLRNWVVALGERRDTFLLRRCAFSAISFTFQSTFPAERWPHVSENSAIFRKYSRFAPIGSRVFKRSLGLEPAATHSCSYFLAAQSAT